MNIKLPYTYENSLDDVNLIIKNNSLENIGNVTNFTNFNIRLNYNSFDEISFDVYEIINSQRCKFWELIDDLKNVYVEEANEVFKIYVSIDDSDCTIKHVNGKSLCEDELSNIKIYDTFINNSDDILREDYTSPTVFYNDNHKISLLHRVLEKAPHYIIGHVDESLKGLQYVFEFDSMSIYDALMEISDKIGCIFKFDSLARTINVYDLKNYCIDCQKRFDEKLNTCPECGGHNIVKGDGNDTVITVSKNNIASIMNLDSNEESYKNCLRIKTGDEMIDATIKNINPNGSEYIYYFNDKILNDMPVSLVDKIHEYNALNDYYVNEYSFTFDDVALKNKYNTLVSKYNSDKYRNYKHNENGDRVLKNNEYISIDNNITGFNKLIELYYDNIDFSGYIEHSLMPFVLEDETTIEQDISKLTVENLNGIALSELSSSTSQSTVELYIKKYCPLYLKNSYLIEVNTNDYRYVGEKSDGWNYGTWSGTIKLTQYGVDGETAVTPTITLEINNNYQTFLNDKILLNLKSQDDAIGSIYNIMGITNINEFKDALKLYSLVRLNSFADAYQGAINIMIESDHANESSDFYNSIYIPLYNKLTCIKEEVSLRTEELEIINNIESKIDEIKYQIQKSLNFEDYIGIDLWKVLNTYRREDVYTNDNITSEGLDNKGIIDLAKDVINNAYDNIKEIGYMQKSITSSLNNFLMIKEFKTYIDDFNLGNWIVTEVADELFRQRLISINISISNDVTISVELSQVTRNEDELSDIKSILEQSSSLATSIGEIKNSIIQSNNNNSLLNNWVQKGLDLTNLKIMSSVKEQSVIYDKNGLLVRTYDELTETYGDEQLRVINSTIAITDDNWKHVRTALGKYRYIDPLTGEERTSYGIIGETIVGKLLIGEELVLKSQNNSLIFDDNGLTINSISNLTNRSIFKIQKDGVNKLYLDDNGNIVGNDITINNLIAKSGSFTGTLETVLGHIGGFTIGSNKLISTNIGMASSSAGGYAFWAGSDTPSEAPFRVDHNGNTVLTKLVATGVDITGKITATSGSFSGSITGGTLNINNNTIIDANGHLKCIDGDMSGKITANNGIIGGWTVNSNGFTNGTAKIDKSGITNIYTWADLYIIRLIIMGDITPDDDMIAHYDFNNNGRIDAADYVILKNRLSDL